MLFLTDTKIGTIANCKVKEGYDDLKVSEAILC